MDSLFADLTVSMSDFKKNPAKILREAGKKPVAVLNHNKAAFYMIEPSLYEALLENAYDRGDRNSSKDSPRATERSDRGGY